MSTPAVRRIRRREVPTRRLGNRLIVARPADGAPVVLAATAASVWVELEDWTTADQIERRLAEAFPRVSDADRHQALDQILAALEADDLLARA